MKEEIKTTSFVSLPGYLLLPYGRFSVFQYLKVQVQSLNNKASQGSSKPGVICPL